MILFETFRIFILLFWEDIQSIGGLSPLPRLQVSSLISFEYWSDKDEEEVDSENINWISLSFISNKILSDDKLIFTTPSLSRLLHIWKVNFTFISVPFNSGECTECNLIEMQIPIWQPRWPSWRSESSDIEIFCPPHITTNYLHSASPGPLPKCAHNCLS